LSFWNTKAIEELALSHQKNDTQSLWNDYKALIGIRQSNTAFRLGDYEPILLEYKDVFAFKRTYNNQWCMVIINTSDRAIEIDLTDFKLGNILYDHHSDIISNKLFLKGYGYNVSKMP